MTERELEKLIVKMMSLPARFDDYPKAEIVDFYPEFKDGSWMGTHYPRAKCPECGQLCLIKGFNSHYTKQHRPDNTRQIAKQIIKVIREADNERA
jgi:hypothetical protein